MSYETIIGLEVHVQLFTKSKIFCGCSTNFGAPPNTQTCPVCLGLPGVLPVLNHEALRFAIKVGLALDCRIAERMKFDRKNYFYPDLPKNFQISQYDLPLANDGHLELETEDGIKTIRIRRVHLEEDAGKLLHMEGEDSSLVDFNRTGIPLLEIVSEPDITSPEEAHDYLVKLKSILKYLEVSDCNMEEGSLRCDANISIRTRGKKELGVKTELKNMNTFKGVRSALWYEARRQREVLEEGGTIKQETRLWNEKNGRTYSMRTKEEAFDYRYFPEPDLVPFLLDREFVESMKKTIPELPQERLKRLEKEYRLSLSSALFLVQEKKLADLFEESAKNNKERGQIIANWITGDIMAEANKKNTPVWELIKNPKHISEIAQIIEDGSATGKMVKGIIPEMIDSGKGPREIIESRGLSQIKDEAEIEKILGEVIEKNQKPVKDYKEGKPGALTFLVGQVMKETKGKANPKIVNKLLKRRMEKL